MTERGRGEGRSDRRDPGGPAPFDARLAWCALASLPGIGPSRLWSIAEDDPVIVWRELVAGGVPPEWSRRRSREGGENWVAAARSVDLAALDRRLRDGHVVVTTWGERAHPALALGDPHVPPVLFWRGSGALPPVDAARRPAVGIVGTRRATRAGREWAADLAAALADAGCEVVSGLALGVDAAAHRGALASLADGAPGGVTAVVGSGLDVPYPSANRGLWAEVATRGRLCSEYPLGTPPAPWRFPARNRILVALCDALVVVESHRSGGSLITAAIAGDRGVPVLAVPGALQSAASEGTNRLIADGCAPCLGVDDVATAVALVRATRGESPPGSSGSRAGFGSGPRAPGGTDGSASGALDPVEEAVLDALGWSPRSLNELVDSCAGRGLGAVMVAVRSLVARGMVEEVDGSLERCR